MSTLSGIHMLTVYRAWWRYFRDIALIHFPKANGQNYNKHWKMHQGVIEEVNSKEPDENG
ncbi:hypothetical protein BH24ACT22_BH24ACT22_08710 [soil metagenome]